MVVDTRRSRRDGADRDAKHIFQPRAIQRQYNKGTAHTYDYQTDRGIWVMKTTRLPAVLAATEDRAPSGLAGSGSAGTGRDATKGRSARCEGADTPLLSVPLECKGSY